MKISSFLAAAVLAPLALSAQAQDKKSVSEKNVTVVTATSAADGGSDVTRQRLQDCIASLPDVDRLDAQVSSQSLYVQGINGETGKNGWIKSYTARIDVSYLTREKDLIIVTTRSVNGEPPVLREVDKTLRHTQTFLSNSTEGDTYAGRSDRQYYFTTAEGAVRDVKARAKVWVNQQQAVVCPGK
jgi:hypothetical protein